MCIYEQKSSYLNLFSNIIYKYKHICLSAAQFYLRNQLYMYVCALFLKRKEKTMIVSVNDRLSHQFWW